MGGSEGAGEAAMAPPAEPAARPKTAAPPPKFAAPPPKFDTAGAVPKRPDTAISSDVKAQAIAAAAAAIAHAAPGQRDALIAQAAASAVARQPAPQPAAAQPAAAGEGAAGAAAGDGAAAPQPPAAPATYEPPDWAGVPEGIEYTIEVLKNGTILEARPIADKDHYTFGRSPTADFPLEHPSASRLHFVIQYNGATGEAFAYDASSTHGTFLNRNRLKPRVFAPLKVGDTLRYGSSSRLFVFGGPAELMPEEGLTRRQKQQLAALQYAQKAKEQDLEKSQAAMEAALHRGGGASWGMGAADDLEDYVNERSKLENVNWRSHQAKHGLTDKQAKQAEKIRQKEYKLANLRSESERIMAREKREGGLTPGQAATLASLEQKMEALAEELEELEEGLDESVRESLSEKLKTVVPKAAKRKRGNDSDDEYLALSDDEDGFYDRTAGTGGAKKGPNVAANGKGAKGAVAQPPPETAESLYGKKEVLTEERKRLEGLLAAEEAVLEAARASTATHSAGTAGSGADGGASRSGAAAGGGAAEDSLDAFMSAVESKVEEDKVGFLKKEIAAVDAALARTEKLLRIADPDQWYKPSAAKAAAAKAKAAALLEAERKRKAAAEAAAQRKRAAEAAASAEPEVEEEGPAAGTASAAPAATSLQTTGAPASAGASSGAAIKPGLSIKLKMAAGAAAKGGGAKGGLLIRGPQGAAQPTAGTAGTAATAAPAAAATRPLSAVPRAAAADGAAAQAASVDAAAEAAAAAKVAADLALLAGRSRRPPADDGDAEMTEAVADEAAGGWQAPKDQSGDGRTKLNDLYGY